MASDADTSTHWPKGVRPISINKMDLLGIDDRNRLYWDGARVETSYRLTRWQTIGAVLVTGSAVVAAAASVVQAYAACAALM